MLSECGGKPFCDNVLCADVLQSLNPQLRDLQPQPRRPLRHKSRRLPSLVRSPTGVCFLRIAVPDQTRAQTRKDTARHLLRAGICWIPTLFDPETITDATVIAADRIAVFIADLV